MYQDDAVSKKANDKKNFVTMKNSSTFAKSF